LTVDSEAQKRDFELEAESAIGFGRIYSRQALPVRGLDV